MGKRYTTLLSIAGSDSIGGAGIQADIKTCSAMGVYAMTVITAVTAQNTRGVDSYEAVNPDLLRAQLKAVLSDVKPDAVKIGMIPDVRSVEIIAAEIGRHKLHNIVVDPVMVATSGSKLSTDESVEALKKLLFPKADLITPNIDEASRLTNIKIEDTVQMILAAMKILSDSRAGAVLVKSGDLQNDTNHASDILSVRGSQPVEIVHRRINTRNTHGTGCSLSTAIACGLAKGRILEDAVREGVELVVNAIDGGKDFKLGKGRGPLNFFAMNPQIMLPDNLKTENDGNNNK